jgi:serine/threonine protein kinase
MLWFRGPSDSGRTGSYTNRSRNSLNSNQSDPDDMGTIKICDFGSSELNPSPSSTRHTSSIYNTPRHPESDVSGYLQTSSCDMWMLGCVFLEFITWYIGGWQKIEEFRKRINQNQNGPYATDAFFEIFEVPRVGNQARVKPEVAKVSDFVG